jgi:hypothetical protein
MVCGLSQASVRDIGGSGEHAFRDLTDPTGLFQQLFINCHFRSLTVARCVPEKVPQIR